MYINLAVAILAMLQPSILMADELPRPTPYQSDAPTTNKISTGEQSPMSDREKAGLRGPVQQCIEEQTIPAFENVPAATYTTTTKYSSEGRILQSTTSNSVDSGPPEFSTTYTYDSTGRLLKKPSQVLVRPLPNRTTTTMRKDESSSSPGSRLELPLSNMTIRVARFASCRPRPNR
jgi:hypothetical protein